MPVRPFLNYDDLRPVGLSMLLTLGCATACGDDGATVSTSFDPTMGSATTDATTGSTDGSTSGTRTTGVSQTGVDESSSGDVTETDSDSADTTSGSSSSGGPVIECGNGTLEEGEDCDTDDFGDEDCVSQGFEGGTLTCTDACTIDTASCEYNCGNGALDDGEDCDGDDLAGADCSTLDMMYDRGVLGCNDDCTYDVAQCVTYMCGDGAINGDDVCDGDDLGAEDCVTQSYDGGTLACEAGCAAFDTTGCYVCGDGTVGGDEVCDGSDVGGSDCVAQGFDGGPLGCALDCGGYDTTACYVCGDDTIGGDELCDGTDLGGETCISQGFAGGGTLGCAVDCSGYDTTACIADVCGDGAITGAEECEPDDLQGQTCADEGFVGGTLGCDPVSCTFDTSGCNLCGNGAIDAGESCDGAALGGEDCVTQGFLGGGLGCAADCSALETYSCYDNVATICSSPGTAIGPDITDPLTVDTLNVAGNGAALVDVDVFVDVDHTWSGDMEIDVRYVPADETVRVFDQGCGNADNMLVTYDDGAGAPPSCGSPVGAGGTGTPIEPLASFNNRADGAGDWELTITDTANGDGGTLSEWCVVLSTNSTIGLCGDGTVEAPEDCEGNGLSGTTCEDLGFSGGSLACAGNCAFDTAECSNTVLAYCSAPVAIINDTVSPVTDSVTVAEAQTVGDVDVFVDITHTWASDLEIQLTDPAATTVDLVFDACTGGDNVFAFFNDEGSGAPDCVGTPTIEGNLTPLTPLSAFDGAATNGNWTLTVNDDASGDAGVLNEWCVYITPQ